MQRIHRRGDIPASMRKGVVLNGINLEPVLYREAMSRYAGHVQIVTTALGDMRRGVTITAACSVSDNPPMVLACLNRTNPHNAIFFESGCFALNTMAHDRVDLADAFSGRSGLDSEARFAMAAWKTLATGAPVLEDALVSFDCRTVEMKETSTHMVLFGLVEAIHFGERRESLIYLDRAYHGL